MISNKILNRITKVSKNPQQNNSETVTKKNDKEIPKERYIFPEKIIIADVVVKSYDGRIVKA